MFNIGVLMWEIWTGGDMPYGKMRNPDVVDHVCNGSGKLDKPSAAPSAVYEIMTDCWRKVRTMKFLNYFFNILNTCQTCNLVSSFCQQFWKNLEVYFFVNSV